MSNNTDLVPITEELADKIRVLGIEPVLTYAVPRNVVEAMASLAQGLSSPTQKSRKRATQKRNRPPIKTLRIPLNPANPPSEGTKIHAAYSILLDTFKRGEVFSREQACAVLSNRQITYPWWMLSDLANGDYVEVVDRGYES